ncbi:MAG: endonuclease III domain-containing protein [Deltaproteobacteria bacterium]|nr:endonuclease III domain-containing protein [Deltaproteobacteria bacterium]
MSTPDPFSKATQTETFLKEIYGRLLRAFGPQNWWPGDTAFEVMVGAVLTQNTAWSNVEKAIANIKAEGLLKPELMANLPKEKLASLIKPAGYYNIKADRLKNLLSLVMAHGGGNPPRLLNRPLQPLRRDLLAVKGVGPETADSILLYAAGYPIFVIDAYTHRVLHRHGLADGKASYEELQGLFMRSLPHDSTLYNEYHALLVHLGKNFCKPKPLCQGCPLEALRKDLPFET